MDSTPFHAGERAIQARLGLEARMRGIGARVIRDHMPEQHQAFYAQLPFVLVGSVDREGRPWASALAGERGFMRATDPTTLRIDAIPPAGDPLARALVEGAPLGLLGIELETRRRNRVNGRVSARHEGGFTLTVEQTVGNCPQHIHPRQLRRGPTSAPVVQPLSALDEATIGWIQRADTFYVATVAPPEPGEPGRGADVSHRGGPAGFVQVLDANTLLIPDYAGNNLFMTLGNLMVYPRAGLLFIDLETGDLLQLTGSAEILWDWKGSPDAERAWRFTVEGGQALRGALPLRANAA